MKSLRLLPLALACPLLGAAEAPLPDFDQNRIERPPLSLRESIRDGKLPPPRASFESPGFATRQALAARQQQAARTPISRMPVLPPDDSVDHKMRVHEPDRRTDFKILEHPPAVKSDPAK